jgi:hypothetical protein
MNACARGYPRKRASLRIVVRLSQLHSLSVEISVIRLLRKAPLSAREAALPNLQQRFGEDGGLIPKLWRNRTSPMRQAIALRENLRTVRDRSRKILYNISVRTTYLIRTAGSQRDAPLEAFCRAPVTNGLQRCDKPEEALSRTDTNQNPFRTRKPKAARNLTHGSS